MISSIRGTLTHLGPDHAVIETGGIGWLIYAPRPVLGGMGSIGDMALLHTMLIVREDAMTLYGFATGAQRQFFTSLIAVSGIGPRLALAMLSAGDLDEIRGAIAHGDTARLARIPGIGKKTAERLVLELKGKLDLSGLTPAPSGANPADAALNRELAELLTSLGYSAAEASSALAAMPSDAPADLEERLRLALRHFGGV